ncbi:hypothetical protein JCM30237_03320 [Halolamina litorea]
MVAGSASAQTEVTERFEFNGVTAGWEGLAPSSIEGTTNPTLSLEAGQTYEFYWENGDGAPHNVVIEDADGNALVESEFVSSQGESQTVQFTAEAGMASYYCAAHPSSMRGDVEITGGGASTATPTPEPAGEPQTHEVKMVSSDDGSFYFDPIGLHVQPGDTISWVIDSGSHNVVSYDERIPEGADTFDTEIISEGSHDLTFETEGTYDYYCMPHRTLGMIGRFVVGEPGGPAEGSNPEDGELPASSDIVEQGSISYEAFTSGGSGDGTATAEATATPEGTPAQVTSADPEEQDQPTEASGPGFTAAGALSAIGAGALLRAYRTRDE